jgi:HK97 family phage portal protein
VNFIQRAAFNIWQKAVGFPAWSVSDFQAYQNSMRLSSGDAWSGSLVTGVSALQLAAVWSCISILARVKASFPIDIVVKKDGVDIAEDHYLGELLDQAPNPYMTAFDFHEAMTLQLGLSGNAFAQIVKVGKRVTALWPLQMERMRVVLERGELRYEYSAPDGTVKKLTPEEVLHVKFFSIDGITGLSPIAYQRETMGHALAAQRYGATLFRTGGVPTGVLQHPGNLKPEARDKLREDWQKMHSGQAAVAVLFEGMTYSKIGMSMDDAQFIGTMRLSAAQIHDIYGVPFDFSAMAEKTATYASSEQYNRKFVDYTMAPLCRRFEQAYKRSLLSTEKGVTAIHNMDSLLRGDSAARAAYLGTLVDKGLMKRNEARQKLNLPAVDGGDDLTVQSNMIDLADLQKIGAQPAPQLPAGGTQ